MKASHVIFAITLSGATLAGTTLASAPANPANPAPTAPTSESWLGIPSIYAKVIAAGYNDVYEIEREHHGYKIKAIAPNGQRVKLLVDPVSGEVLQSRSRQEKSRYRREDSSTRL